MTMDAKITFLETTFVFSDDWTEVHVSFTSNEPDNPIWGNRTVAKRFAKEYDIVGLMQGPVGEDLKSWEYLHWRITDPVVPFKEAAKS